MTLIQESLLELQNLSTEASTPLQNIPTKNKAGIEGRIRAAQAKLPLAKEKYFKQVADSAVFIPVTGSAAVEFAETAEKYFGAFAVNYNKLTANVFEALRKRSYVSVYSANTHAALLTELATIKSLLNLRKLTHPPFYNGSQNTDVFAILKKQFDEFYDAELNMLFIKKELGDYALSEGFDGESLPVIMYGYEGTNYAKHVKAENEITIEKQNEEQKITANEVKQVLMQLKKEKML